MTIHTIALGSFISVMPYNSYIHKENLGNLSYGGGIIWNKNNNLCLYLPKGGTPVNLWSLEEKGAQLPVYCMLLVKAATEPRVKGREQTPATWWERHWRIRGCRTSFPICFHLKPGVDTYPRLLPQPLLYVHQLLQPCYPSLRASGIWHASFWLPPSCVLRTQSRQLQSQMTTGTVFKGIVSQSLQYFWKHEGF